MNFRSHLSRAFGFRYPTHRLVVAIGVIVGVVAAVGWLNDTKTVGALLAPIYVGVVWALVREIDSDNDWTAIAAAAFAGWWVLQQHPVVSALAVGAMAVSARIISETTGRRPLVTDLIVVAILGIGVAYTVEGWVAGLGVAGAMVVDHRRAERRLRVQPWIALATAIGASVTAWVTGVELSAGAVSARAALAAAVAAFVLIIRRPVPPTSLVDARRKTPLLQSRIHASRAVTGIVVYGMAVTLNSLDAMDLTPLLVALALVIISNEVEGITRRS